MLFNCTVSWLCVGTICICSAMHTSGSFAQLACCCIFYAFNCYRRQCECTCADGRQQHIMQSILYAIAASAAVGQLAVK